jgi:putative ABC transport system substrate-binding protein
MDKRDAVMAMFVLCGVPMLSLSQQQQRKIWRIGVLLQTGANSVGDLDSFKASLHDLGYDETRNYVFEFRFAEGDPGRLPTLAAELVAQWVDLIMAFNTPIAVAAKNATRVIPIVMFSGDPIGAGLIASYGRPGGNVTGLSGESLGTGPKKISLLRQLMPGIRRVGILYDPTNAPDVAALAENERVSKENGLESVSAPATNAEEVIGAFVRFKRGGAQAIMVGWTTRIGASQDLIITQAAKHRVPAIYGSENIADAGGLISYSPDRTETVRRLAHYVDRILKGAKPSELPVELPSKFKLVVNMKTAKAQGLTIPQSILIQADRLIE